METEISYFYNPSRGDTKTELQSLRNIVERQLGGFRPIVIVGVADMVLWILKSDHRFNTPTHKREEVEKLLNPIADHVFEQMLHIAQRITDYLTQRSTTHPYRFVAHGDRPMTTMEDVVTYNLLIQVYNNRDKAFDMVLILKNQCSIRSIDAQKQMIRNLLGLISNRADCDLLVFIISKLFPDFVGRWDNLALYVIPAKTLTFKGSKSGESGDGEDRECCRLGRLSAIFKVILGYGESEDGDVKVVDSLRMFSFAAPHRKVMRFNESCTRTIHEGEVWSGGFEESENELRNVGAYRRRQRPYLDDDHDQRRRGNGNGDSGGRMGNEGGSSSSLSSLVRLVKSIFRS